MKSRYRSDPGSLSAITRLPTDDDTPAKTGTRMQLMIDLWTALPNPPGSATPFKAWDTMDLPAFEALYATLNAKRAALSVADEEYEVAEGKLHHQEDLMADSATAALTQGRMQFPLGTPEREAIDTIPSEPAAQEPGQAVISVATSPAAGEVHLEYDAPHATRWDVLHQGPGETDFSVVAADVIVKVYDATGLLAGDHQYKVVGRNSRGEGPESSIATVTVS